MSGKFVTAFAAASVLSLAAGVAISSPYNVDNALAKRNDYPGVPPCSYPYTPFDYVGCYVDPSLPNRALDYGTGLPTNNMTVELCTAECKANGFRYAGLEYYGECFCGDTVEGPAAPSPSNCSYACTGNSAEVCGGFDFVSVYMDPTFNPIDTTTISDYMPLGCYSEGVGGRAVAFQQNQLNGSLMTTELCLQTCKDEGYPFAATEFASQCFCGVVISYGGAPADDSNCNMPCNGNPSEICGGASYLNLYVANDLEEVSPCTPTSPATTAASSTTVASSTTTSTTTTTTTTPTTTSTTSTTISTTSTTTTTTSTTPTSTTSTTSTTPTTTSTTSTTTTTTTTTSTTPTTTSTTTTSTTLTSTSHSTTSTTCTTPTSTLITSTTKTTSTTSTASHCTSTAPAPTCEYKCGSWCSNPLPYFNDQPSCRAAAAAGQLQVANCFAQAGWTYASQCFEYASWCQSIANYANNWQSGRSSRGDCYSRNPPSGPPVTSTPGVCTPSTTTTPAPSTATTVCPPTATNICNQPSGPWGPGSQSGSCVGNIQLPVVTCNNVHSDWYNNPFKCYTSQNTYQCQSYSRNNVQQACQDACTWQYNSCMSVYAQGCKGQQQTQQQDSYNSASQKCNNQYQACQQVNSGRSFSVPSSRCNSWNGGWS